MKCRKSTSAGPHGPPSERSNLPDALAGAITAALGEYVDSAVIFGVVALNAVVGFIQESKAEAALEGLRSMVRTRAEVVRDGRRRTVPSDELVPGDLVLLEAGDKVPADLRLIRSTELTRKLAEYSKILTVGIPALATLTFGVGLLRGQDAVETFTAAIALAVGAIPEGLPAAVTITLAIGVARMARRRAVIRRLPAVETLGGTTDQLAPPARDQPG